MALRLLLQQQADEGTLTLSQARQIKKRVPQGKARSVRSSLMDIEPA